MSDARAPGPEAGAARAEPAGAVLSVDVAGLLAQLARSFVLLLPVYALGYLGLSFSWVLLALALLLWCRRSRGLKATRLCRALALLEDEERAVRLGVRACDLPAWVSGKRADPAPPPARARVVRGDECRAPTCLVESAPRRAPSLPTGPGRCLRRCHPHPPTSGRPGRRRCPPSPAWPGADVRSRSLSARPTGLNQLSSPLSRTRPSGHCRPAVAVRAGFPQPPPPRRPQA